MKQTLLFLLSFLFITTLTAQTTLERNAKTSQDKKEIIDYSKKYYFSYQDIIVPRNGSYREVSFEGDVKYDSSILLSRSLTNDERIALRNQLQVSQQATEMLFKSKTEALSAGIKKLSDSLDVVDFNTSKLVNYTWDVYNKVDTGSRIDDREAFFDTLVTFRTEAERFAYRQVELLYDTLAALKSELQLLSHPLTPLALSDTVRFNALEKRVSELEHNIVQKRVRFTEHYNNWNRIVVKFIRKKDPPKEDKVNVAALPFFNVIPGIRDISATLSVFGTNTLDDPKRGIYVEFGGYTGILGSSDELNRYSLFMPEISTYGFFFRNNVSLYTAANTDKTNVGLNFSFYYLGKKIKADTASETKAFTTNSFHAKVGLEWVPVDNFSVYGNTNLLGFMSNRNKVKELYAYNADVQNFVDFGFRMLLNPAPNLKLDSWKLYFDLNFIVNKDDIKNIGGSDDVIIPNFRVGLRKTFGRQ